MTRERTAPEHGWSLGWKVGLDGSAVVVGAALAYLARFEATPPGVYATQAYMVVPLLAFVRVVVLLRAGAYRRSWRHTGLADAVELGLFHGAVSIVLIAVRLISPHFESGFTPIPLSVIGVEGLFALGAGATARSLVRVRHERASRRTRESVTSTRRTLLVGADREGWHAARELSARPDLGYEVVGFLDDDVGRRGLVIGGVEVLGATDELPEVARRVEADLAVLTDSSCSPRALRDFMRRCKDAGISAHRLPALPDLLARRTSVIEIEPLDMTRLLGREEVGFCAKSWSRVKRACRGRRILVTGAGGSIGSELCRQLADLHPELIILVDNNENNLFDIDNEIRRMGRDIGRACLTDIRRTDELQAVFAAYTPHVVFHAAAFKHVPMMEAHPCAAVRNNVMGTRLLTEVARRHGVERFVMISTDKAVRPTNVMGATKQVAEKVVQTSDDEGSTRACCVRFGNVLGSRGSVFHTFAGQIARGGPVTVTHPEITRFFMTIPEAVRLVIQAMSVSEGGEIFLLEMGEPVQILDLAKQMIEFSGASAAQIPIVFSGLRPGEKLHEELVYEHEETLSCDVDGLLVARPQPAGPGKRWTVARAVADLEAAARSGDAFEVRDQLAKFTDCPVLSHRATLQQAR